MGDETKRGSPNDQRISAKNSKDVVNWANSLGVTPVRLKEAVKAVGTSVNKVREYLAKKSHRVGRAP